MPEGYSLLFLLSCIGVINALILSVYFFYTSNPNQTQNRFLAALFLVLSVRIGKSVIFFFFEDIEYLAIYLQLGLSACFLIGPLLYFYVYSFLNQRSSPHWREQLVVYTLLITAVYFAFPYLEFREAWWCYFIPVIHFQWFVYLYLSGLEIWRNWKKLEVKGQGFFNRKSWILSIFSGVALIWLAYMTSNLTSYIVGALSFTFMLYILLFLLLMGFNRPGILTPKYGGKQIQSPDATAIFDQLNRTLEENYTDSSLTLTLLADKMGVSKQQISQVLNAHYQTNFAGFLRKFRVEKVKELILTNEQYTLQAIGEECGFKAKSSFYTAFKKETGMTPLQFKQQNTPKRGSDSQN